MNSVNSLRVLAGRSVALAQPPVRKLSEEIMKREIYPPFIKVQEKYAKFQRKDGIPTHLKGGFWDDVLYRATIGGTIINVLWAGSFFLELINK